MPYPATYRTGTVTVAAGGTSVTGIGTNFLAFGIRAGDILSLKGLTVSIASVESGTALTLADPWPGTAQTSQPYEIRYLGDPSRVLSATHAALAAIEAGGGGGGYSGPVAWADLTDVPATFPPSAHTHGWGQITNKPATYAPSAHRHNASEIDGITATAWADITGKPATYTPSEHGHVIGDVQDLTDALEAKSEIGHRHDASEIDNLPSGGGSTAWADLTGVPASFPPSAHTHATSEVTGLDAALGAKLDASLVSAAALTLLDDTTTAAMRTTLGIGSDAVKAYASRADLASDVSSLAAGAIVSVGGINAVVDPTATGNASALHDLGVNGVRLIGSDIDADFWLHGAGASADHSALIQACFTYSLAHRQAQGGNGATRTILRGRHWVEEPLNFGGAAALALDAAGAVLMARSGGSLFDTAATEAGAKFILSLVNAGQTTHNLPYLICNHGCNGVYLSSSFNAIYNCGRILYYLWRGLRIDREIGKNAGSVLYDLTGDEWGAGEAQFNYEASYKAIGLLVDTNDIRVVNAHIGYSKYAIWNGPEGFGVEYINCHPYVGNPNINGGTAPVGAEKRQHPRVFVNQCSGVVNVYDCYFDGGYVDDQTGTVNFHGCWGVPSEWVNWANADSVLTKPILRIRKQANISSMTGSVKDCKMSFGFYVGNWDAGGVFNEPVDMVQDAGFTGGKGYVNHWSQLETRIILDSGAAVDSKTIKQGGAAQVIREEYRPGTGGKVTVDYGSNYMRVRRNSGGGRIDVNTDQTGIASNGTDLQLYAADALRVVVQNNGVTRPATDNAQNLGSPSNRWAVMYAGTGTINTSDARLKQDVRDLSEAERAVAARVKTAVKAFRFTDAVAEKGAGARTHIGVIAQDVIAAFAAEGLDAFDYGIVCHDEWSADGDTPAGDRYSIRYDELAMFLMGAT